MLPSTLYIKDAVYGASDGIITTFAVVAGIVGAGLSTRIIVIIGLASLFADAFSMASANYLGSKSEKAALLNEEGEIASHMHIDNPLISALTTFVAFTVVGILPLIPFLFFGDGARFIHAVIFTASALFVVGAGRTVVTKRNIFVSALEMLVVGGIAAGIAYIVGDVISSLV